MNVKNKSHIIYLDYKSSLMLKSIGYPQEPASAYWFKNDRKLYPADRIKKFTGWQKLYIAAPADAELNLYLPDFTMEHKGKFYSIPPGGFMGGTEAEAKSKFIKYLKSKGLIKF